MKLTDHQQKMLDGAFGKGKAMAVQIQIGVGKCFDAERLVPVSRAHVSLSAQEADIWFAGKLLDAGASCAIAPTVNPGYSVDYFRNRLSDAAVENMRKTERIYRGLGARLTYCCTPYLADNVPSYGEIIAFSETNATIYANAVLGARTNRESAASALCAAVTGYAPEYGMILQENRFADIAVRVDAKENRQGYSSVPWPSREDQHRGAHRARRGAKRFGQLRPLPHSKCHGGGRARVRPFRRQSAEKGGHHHTV